MRLFQLHFAIQNRPLKGTGGKTWRLPRFLGEYPEQSSRFPRRSRRLWQWVGQIIRDMQTRMHVCHTKLWHTETAKQPLTLVSRTLCTAGHNHCSQHNPETTAKCIDTLRESFFGTCHHTKKQQPTKKWKTGRTVNDTLMNVSTKSSIKSVQILQSKQ